MHILEDEDLNLKCQSDQLSDLQVGCRNRKISSVALIKSFMHASYINNAEKSSEGLAALQSLVILQSQDASQFVQYGGSGRYARNYNKGSNAMKNGVASQVPSVPAPITRRPRTTKLSPVVPVSGVTQSLRATRKSTGSLPPPKINLHDVEDSDPEIEVIKETTKPRPKIGVKPQNLLSIASKLTAQKSSGNPLILLNINVRPQNLASPQLNMTSRRELDAKVKTILIKTAPEFTEWLLAEGLIRTVQHCAVHKNFAGQPAKLKLGMFSDPKVHIVSGGYVWLAECCVRKYISVFSGSIFSNFDEEKIPPTSVIKLIYHWSCQTAIANVETWVKIAKNLVSRVYQYLRCICSAVVHNKVFDFGVNFTDVELGIVSLGTTTADGLKKAVKVEILGLYDRNTAAYRLFACTPEPANSSRERFTRILKPVLQVVHPNATLICDYSVDPSTLNYRRVHMCNTDDLKDPQSNSTIMAYLRKHVPRMFQANLSQLTEYQVQLVLDELCWREKYAQTASSCYDKISGHISYITGKETENCGVVPLLRSIGENPHKVWRYKQGGPPKSPIVAPPPTFLVATEIPVVHETQIPDIKVANPDAHGNKVSSTMSETAKSSRIAGRAAAAQSSSMVVTQLKPNAEPLPARAVLKDQGFQDLEQYFYGRVEGDASLGLEANNCNFKCSVCSEDFGNDNVSFYTHMRLHVDGVTLLKENISKACQYCCKVLEIGQVASHIVNQHLMADIGQLWCRICCEQFFSDNQLKTHMMKKHVEAEMPYRCGVCSYATSFFYDAIDHFDKAHRGSPYVQCRICLMVKSITPGNEASFALSFFQHCQKHSLKLACKSCQLNFYNKATHTEHIKEHLCCANIRNLIRYKAPSGCKKLEFRPVIRNWPIKNTSSDTCQPAQGLVAMSSTVVTFKKQKLDVSDDYHCMECGKSLKTDGHFRTYRKCLKCPFSTCCLTSFFQHIDLFHPGNSAAAKAYTLGNPTTLPSTHTCQCGYSTRSGNHLARHMAITKHTKTAAVPPPSKPMELEPMAPGPMESEPMEYEPMESEEERDIPDDFLMPVAVEMTEES